METPKNAQEEIRIMRNHTPRLSARKKKLFCTEKISDVRNVEEEFLNGIEPLSSSRSNGLKSTKVMESLLDSSKSPRIASFFETESDEGDTYEEQKQSPSRRSVRLSLKQFPNFSKSGPELCTSHKENIPLETPAEKDTQDAKQLQKMFNNSMQITPRDKSSMVIEDTSSEDEVKVKGNLTHNTFVNKRHYESETSTGFSPERKVSKTAYSVDSVSISTTSFYSCKPNTSPSNLAIRPKCRNLFGQTANSSPVAHAKSKHTARRSISSQSTSINRGVHHKVRKRINNLNLGSKHLPTVDIDQILNNVRNEKLRKLIINKRMEKQQIEKVHNIFRKASNPIAMAKPLSSLSNQDDTNNNVINDKVGECKSIERSEPTYQPDIDFSDIECNIDADEEGDEKSDLEDSHMLMNEDVIPLITYQADASVNNSPPLVKKKFFKSGCTTATRKEVHLTDNIKATLTANGKLAIVPEKRKIKKQIKIRNSFGNEFSDEQATVDAILRNLDDTGFGDISLPKDGEADNALNLNAHSNNIFINEIANQSDLINAETSPSLIDDIVLADNPDFRKRLPYNTTDPKIIERQHILLDFLISNDICTEENFKIFIVDPDNHKVEAERIIDELVIVVADNQKTDFRQRIPYNTTDQEVIEQQHNFLDFLLENNICTEENFDIFIGSYSQRKAEATAILSQYVTPADHQYIENTTQMSLDTKNKSFNSLDNTDNNITRLTQSIMQTPVTSTVTTNAELNMDTTNAIPLAIQNDSEQQPKLFPIFYPGGCQPLPQLYTRRKQQQRLWNAGYGLNQYQIDAGQKAFGAHQCKQCGLVYTVHEPEEEKLHRDFHASLHILRFKGWIDEDVVAIYPEWGVDGRILRITESSPPKRCERLLDILKIVDKELGFSSYILPKTFVAYFAVRKMQIVGLCLVQPLSKAKKYICVNGIDCCSEDEFEAKCGISRIWVSPLHRRFNIGTKLIQAVQLNTIFAEEVPLDKIAFSAPTELGKAFAQKITKTENFLVYL